jgi:hypothetical protein
VYAEINSINTGTYKNNVVNNINHSSLNPISRLNENISQIVEIIFEKNVDVDCTDFLFGSTQTHPKASQTS